MRDLLISRMLAAKSFVFVIAITTLSIGQFRTIDARNSRIIVRASKTGLFSAFADNHEIEAWISEGVIDEAARRVRLVIDARRMKVLDPQLSSGKRQQVQERMLGPDVLDVTRFPRISFESTTVETASPGRLIVHAQLSLHGIERPVVISVRTEAGRYLGTAKLKQSEFGIAPISIAGGTVKVKDELQIEFDIRTSK